MKIKILIVDDSKTIRLSHYTMLQGLGYEIYEARDGVEALEKIKANRPHVVVMDLAMPNMDGITCCHKVKSDKTLMETKIMICTSEVDYGKVAEAFKAGCDDYISKPVDRDKLLQKVEEMSVFVRLRQKVRNCAAHFDSPSSSV